MMERLPPAALLIDWLQQVSGGGVRGAGGLGGDAAPLIN